MRHSAPSKLYEVIWHTRRLFQRLRATSDELLNGTGINASHRAMLEFLYQEEPQTVPQIAREKSVSRQHIQIVATELLDQGLIEALKNPAHKRSPLIQLTAKGRSLFGSIRKTEAALLASMEKKFSLQDLTTAARLLKGLDDYLQSGEWRTGINI
jgi:DNA-binding MarR family transcriptional regulator